jgi:hypothetical protein
MSFYNLEVLKGKPTKFLGIMPHLKVSRPYGSRIKKLKIKQNVQLI